MNEKLRTLTTKTCEILGAPFAVSVAFMAAAPYGGEIHLLWAIPAAIGTLPLSPFFLAWLHLRDDED